ncbi:N-terminal binuclear Zn cluster-containing/DNA binding domain-containing protein [Beauveria brongniartii RCEF 3172]|uniref:N-terminal binuclear Zn cluster-containing/DNA binding domain-containing protein n=1 Tax=Beauveria brongniartii RCEF 3172 TaxID=1081107 RepID=A0A167HQM0_9HYPO|nr:N-terminal binuclear Zn cluster-containing/DNA binding domain-containing protein [Beauveria brongniartii RCEF 3172]
MEETQTPMGESIRTSCERCRRRKIKCDRKRPCSRCVKAGKECILQGTGEKQRPVSKSYVIALEGQIAALEQVIRRLAQADGAERDEILAQLPALSVAAAPDGGGGGGSGPEKTETPPDPSVVAARLRSGQLRRLHPSQGAQFFGGTSFLQMHLSRESSMPAGSTSAPLPPHTAGSTLQDAGFDAAALPSVIMPSVGLVSESDESPPPRSSSFQYAPHDEMSQKLMATFFKEQYQYSMIVYREYFLRDYDVGSGQHYSDVLLYAICALGALQHDDTLNVSDVFAGQAQALLYGSLDSPDLTLLQALVLLGYREIAVGRASKGWLFCGMAFRLAHEMGLHLDPSNWEGGPDGGGGGGGGGVIVHRDREILRRVYWAVFVADKQLSLYFGRPPALYPNESDVRNTIRLQYPPDWQGLLETYLCEKVSATEFEDGVALVGSFIYRAELSKIIHVMITDLFENRRGDSDPAVVAAKSRQIHVSLTKWLSSLPGTVHWNQWTVGKVPPSVLHLHMVFHTVMMILHRPPSNMFDKPGIAESEDVEICYESLQAIQRLMRSFSRFYRYRSLPLDFVQTLATATGIVLMRRYLLKASWTDPEVERSVSLLLDAMSEIQNTWPPVREIRDTLVRAQQSQAVLPPDVPFAGNDLMTGMHFDVAAMGDFMPSFGSGGGGGGEGADEDIEALITDEFLSAQLQTTEEMLQPFDFNQPPEMS